MNQVGQKPSADLVMSCQGLVRSIAWKIHQKLPRSIDLDDLVGYGQIGLSEAARDFDQQRGVQFTTYAYYRVRGAILDGLSSMAWFSKADYNRGRYEQAANAILESRPDDSLPEDDVTWLGQTTRVLSMTWIMTQWGGEGADSAFSETVTPCDVAEAGDLQALLREVIDELPEQQQQLIRGIYFEGLSIKEAGERIGISKAWASRLHARTLDCLALRMTDGND
ncbi:MAG: sigma-70 family RNA polymerase sigma factor [Planctomycetaceae bacterium]